MLDLVFDKEAVRRAMQERRVTQEALADAVGLTHKSAVAKILSGERQVKVDEAAKIYRHLELTPIAHERARIVPIIGFASAGSWREAVQMPIGQMTIPSAAAGTRAFAVEVQGDSLNQIVPHGGWIVVDPDDKILATDGVYLLQNHDHEATVKRYQKSPPRFEPVSDNPDHQPFLISDHDFAVIGRVTWKGSPV